MNVKKLLIGLGLLILVGVAGLAGFLALKTPASSPLRPGKVPMTPERIARGQYLFHHVAVCVDCHSPRQWTKYPMPTEANRAGHGVEWPVEEEGVKIIGPNITPDPETGIGQWTDGEKLRAIREGVSRDGRALNPMMPYMAFREMSDDDAESVVAYMNTLAPARNPLTRMKMTFPMSVIAKFLTTAVPGPVKAPDPADRVAYGKYLTAVGTCVFCHTPGDNGPDEKRLYAGGREFKASDKLVVRASNLSPDQETGIGKWSEQRFLDRFAEFKEYTQPNAQFPDVTPANFTVMHWIAFSGMKEDDLRALYAYLRTVPAQVNKVEKYPPRS